MKCLLSKRSSSDWSAALHACGAGSMQPSPIEQEPWEPLTPELSSRSKTAVGRRPGQESTPQEVRAARSFTLKSFHQHGIFFDWMSVASIFKQRNNVALFCASRALRKDQDVSKACRQNRCDFTRGRYATFCGPSHRESECRRLASAAEPS